MHDHDDYRFAMQKKRAEGPIGWTKMVRVRTGNRVGGNGAVAWWSDATNRSPHYSPSQRAAFSRWTRAPR